MQFNPTFHLGVIRNLKTEFQNRYGKNLDLPDVVIWDVFAEWCNVESDDPNDREAPVYEALEDARQLNIAVVVHALEQSAMTWAKDSAELKVILRRIEEFKRCR